MIYTPVNGTAANATYQINGTVLTYHIYCSTDFSATVENPNITDIQILYRVATLDDCITLCASYNYALSSTGATPSGVSFARELHIQSPRPHGRPR
jgi:hypothetical protein